ncbi:MAG: hypothetical protein HQL25_02760 [Candidatus Omnitrophica bacterium]|nr:hypothetical protein [Candidatus Omnitrophota bacterium]
MGSKILRIITVWILFFCAAGSITYWAIAKYKVSDDFRAVKDARSYIQMSLGNYIDIESRYTKRFLMPEIVGLLNRNLHVTEFLDKYYENVEEKVIQLNFGLVNILFITFTAFVFYLFCKDLDFSEMESLLAGFLFITSFNVVTYFTVPLVDSAGCFFVMACFYALKRKNWFGLALFFLLGLMTKESTFVVVLMVMLDKGKIEWRKWAALVPGIVAYFFILSFYGGVSRGGVNVLQIITHFDLLQASVQQGLSSFSIFTIIEWIQTFLFMWVLFIYGLLKCRIPEFLKSQAWLMFLPFIMPFTVGESSVGRVSFYLFPIVICISLLALRKILNTESLENVK